MLAYEYFGEALEFFEFFENGELLLAKEHSWEGCVNIAHASRHCRDAPDEIKDKLESVQKVLRGIRKSLHNSRLTFINEQPAGSVEMNDGTWTPEKVLEEAQSTVYNILLNLYETISEESKV